MPVRNESHPLPAGHTLTVTVVDGAAHVQQIESAAIAARVTNSAPVVFGPYLLDRNFRVQHTGNASVTVAESDGSANIPSTAQKALLDDIPIEDPEDGVSVWNDEGVLKVASAAP